MKKYYREHRAFFRRGLKKSIKRGANSSLLSNQITSGILIAMTIDALIMLAGAVAAALPFLGFPSSIDTILYVIDGMFIIALGIVVRRRGKDPYVPQQKNGGSFTESSPMAPVRHEETPR